MKIKNGIKGILWLWISSFPGRTYELRLDEADIVSNASVSDLAAMQRRVVELERDIEKQNDKDKNLLMRGKPLDAISPRQRNRRMSRLRDQVHSALWFTESFGFSLESVVLRNKDDQSTTTLQLTEKGKSTQCCIMHFVSLAQRWMVQLYIYSFFSLWYACLLPQRTNRTMRWRTANASKLKRPCSCLTSFAAVMSSIMS